MSALLDDRKENLRMFCVPEHRSIEQSLVALHKSAIRQCKDAEKDPDCVQCVFDILLALDATGTGVIPRETFEKAGHPGCIEHEYIAVLKKLGNTTGTNPFFDEMVRECRVGDEAVPILRKRLLSEAQRYRIMTLTERFRYISELKPGWYDGNGLAFPKDGLDWLEKHLKSETLRNFPEPCIFPSEEGLVFVDWTPDASDIDIELQVDIEGKTGMLEVVRLRDTTGDCFDIDLRKDEGWKSLAEKLSELLGTKFEKAV